MICYALTAVMAMGLRLYLSFANRRRELAETAAASPSKPLDLNKDEDVTDFHTPSFRYRL